MARGVTAGVALREMVAQLAAIVGPDHVTDDPPTTERLSRDLSLEPVSPAAAVVRPANASEVSRVMAMAAARRVPIVARGAGLSYTLAHTPAVDGMLLVDDRRMNSISVNADDLYAEVGPGCTWEQLYLATREVGLRPPSWGPLSGRRATIGGTLSQNGAFYGSALHGTVAEIVLGLEVVLGDGRVLRTGSAARRSAPAFSRYYGPDLTGMFLADSGAFGIKTAASLELIPEPKVAIAASFAFDDLPAAIEAMAALARRRLASDIFAFDHFYHELLARLGFSFLARTAWSVHAVAEGDDLVAVERAVQALRRAVGDQGREIDASVPMAMRADPFGTMQTLFQTRSRQVHLPLHALVPLSRARALVAQLQQVLADRATMLLERSIGTWTLATVVGKDLLIEPGLSLEADYANPEFNAAGRAAATQLRRELAEVFGQLGAVHMQVGKFYDYLPGLHEDSAAVVRSLKRLLDPGSTINPGSLGLP